MGTRAPRGQRGLNTSALRTVGVALLLLAAGAARAHVGGTTGYAAIAVNRNTVRYTLNLPTAALTPGLAEALRLAQAGSPQSREQLLDLLRRRISLRANGEPCEPGPGRVLNVTADAPNIALELDFACASAVQDLLVRDDIFDALGPDHHTLAKVEANGEIHEFTFTPDAREARVALAAPVSAREGGGFFRLGVEHILTGYDHLLFLGALLLRGGRLLALLKIVTAFTVAHSVTLALAVLGVVAIPARLVECVIAASIVYVALENILLRDAPSQRWLVSFLFGLVHGFGFASALSPLALPARRLALALLGFNLGVETGQMLVVLLLLPVLVWMRGARWETRAVQAASGAVAVMGFLWFVERLFFV
jgi:hypothetical protein